MNCVLYTRRVFLSLSSRHAKLWVHNVDSSIGWTGWPWMRSKTRARARYLSLLYLHESLDARSHFLFLQILPVAIPVYIVRNEGTIRCTVTQTSSPSRLRETDVPLGFLAASGSWRVTCESRSVRSIFFPSSSSSLHCPTSAVIERVVVVWKFQHVAVGRLENFGTCHRLSCQTGVTVSSQVVVDVAPMAEVSKTVHELSKPHPA